MVLDFAIRNVAHLHGDRHWLIHNPAQLGLRSKDRTTTHAIVVGNFPTLNHKTGNNAMKGRA